MFRLYLSINHKALIFLNSKRYFFNNVTDWKICLVGTLLFVRTYSKACIQWNALKIMLVNSSEHFGVMYFTSLWILPAAFRTAVYGDVYKMRQTYKISWVQLYLLQAYLYVYYARDCLKPGKNNFSFFFDVHCARSNVVFYHVFSSYCSSISYVNIDQVSKFKEI